MTTWCQVHHLMKSSEIITDKVKCIPEIIWRCQVSGDDEVKISKFQIFIVKIENLVFATRRRNIAQSTDLREYILNMPKFFINGWVAMEIQLPKVEEKLENSLNVHKILSVFGAKITKMCSKKTWKILKNMRKCLPLFKWFPKDYRVVFRKVYT